MSVDDEQIALTKIHKAQARRLIARGDYPDMSTLVNDAMTYFISVKSVREPPAKELKALIEKRSKGKFVSMAGSRARIDKIAARKRAKYGI